MLLKGYFKEGPLAASFITVLVYLPNYQLRQSVELLIDTGATKTTILDKDAISLDISYDLLARSKLPILGLGGVVETYIATDAELIFRTDENGIHNEKLRELLVVKHPHPTRT